MREQFSPSIIKTLRDNEIFVFGSNLAGRHAGGAARVAYNRFGAEWGVGVGLQGQSYAIPTMHGGVEVIKPYVDQFIDFARSNRRLTFLVTRIGCGIAGFKDEEIAPLFKDAIDEDNILLPEQFVRCIEIEEHRDTSSLVNWNSSTFLETYRFLKEAMPMNPEEAYSKIKNLRVKAFLNTVEIVNQGFYTTDRGEKITFPNLAHMTEGTWFYSTPVTVDTVPTWGHETTVEVVNSDCLDACVRLIKKGYNPAVLNMASGSNPGGGVLNGAGAQEETIFRRTNIFRSLYQFTDRLEMYPWFTHYIHRRPERERYPLDRNYGGIYTPFAMLFREGENAGYRLMEKPEIMSFISVAGINRPQLRDAMHLADSMVGVTKDKIRTILRIGLLHNHDCLVLGALGCGAFRNPPAHIARLFHEVFNETEFKNKYRHICFAILDDHNAHLKHNPEGNYKPFAREFCHK